MEFTRLMLSKLDKKYKHTQTNTMHYKELGLNVMIKNMLQVLSVFIFSDHTTGNLLLAAMGA